MRALVLTAALSLIAGAAVAGPVTLKSNPTDSDGQVTLGDIFDGADAAASVVVGRRSGPSIVFEASELQGLARQAGLTWANPNGLRRVVVRDAAFAPAVASSSTATSASVTAPASAAPPLAARAERVINRNDMVEVAYQVGGVRLTITGRAEGNAAVGQRLGVRNLQSNRVIDAVAAGPGRAVAGAAVRAQQFAAR